MRSLLLPLVAVLSLVVCGDSAEPKRKSVPIGGEWNLSATSLEKTKLDGKRVVQMMAKGDAKLKKGKNPLLGPWVLEATAAEIECDFPGKRFVLKGPLEIRKQAPDGSSNTVVADTPETSVELAFQGESTRINGPHRMKLDDGTAPKGVATENSAAVDKK